MGTSCRTLAKPSTGAPATLSLRLSERLSCGNAISNAWIATLHRVVVRIGDARARPSRNRARSAALSRSCSRSISARASSSE